MHTVEVADMTCGRCAASITRTVKGLDPAAEVAVDLASKRVRVASAALTASAIGSAIALAGYTARPVADAPATAAAAPRAGGCCCGGGGHTKAGAACH